MVIPEERLANLQEENLTLRRQLEDLKKALSERSDHESDFMPYTTKNPRGAGRKPQNAVWMARYDAVRECVEENLTWQEATSRLKISRATYYRFRDLCLHDMGRK